MRIGLLQETEGEGMAFEQLKEGLREPQVELLGRHLATLENHCGIIEYDSTVLRAKGYGCEVRFTGENLALTGAIRDAILDTEELAMILCSRLVSVAREAFLTLYKLTEEEVADLDAYDLFLLVGKKRGFLVSGGEVNTRRTAEMLLEEFRSAKIGRITLERP